MPEHFWGVTTLVWVAAGYALLLVGLGYLFDWLARRSSQRSVANRTFGFHYHEAHDAWLCPEDQWLWPTAYDTDNRVMRYRGNADICNTCPVKSTCTVSNQGREIVREIDPWPYSDSGRFHRGLATAVAGFSLVIMAMAAVLFHSPVELAVELAVGVLCLGLTVPLGIKLLHHPANLDGLGVTHVRNVSATESTEVLMDRFAQKWGGVANERKAKGVVTRERELLPVVSPTPKPRVGASRLGTNRGWSGVKEAPLHRTTAEALERMVVERSEQLETSASTPGQER